MNDEKLIEFRPGVFARVGEVAIGSDGFAYMLNGRGAWVWQHRPPPGNYTKRSWRKSRGHHLPVPELRPFPVAPDTVNPRTYGWDWKAQQVVR